VEASWLVLEEMKYEPTIRPPVLSELVLELNVWRSMGGPPLGKSSTVN
jgi:hypothetical protein